MSYTPEEVLNLAEQFQQDAQETLTAEAAKKEKISRNPEAKVRNRPSPAFPAESPSVKDDHDHYPLANADQARNAWARAHQTGGKAPAWYSGSYSSFLNALKRKIHSKFPKIELSDGKKKKSSLEVSESLLAKYGS